MITHYHTLGVKPSASIEEIRAAYVDLAVANHPDKGGDEKVMSAINEAYTCLKKDRKRYDRRLAMLLRKCPVCAGSGFRPSGFTEKKICSACNGDCYVAK